VTSTSRPSPPSTASASGCWRSTPCSPARPCWARTSSRAMPRAAARWRSRCGAAHARTADGADFLQRNFATSTAWPMPCAICCRRTPCYRRRPGRRDTRRGARPGSRAPDLRRAWRRGPRCAGGGVRARAS
jgi:hypothetical protein